MKKLFCYGIAAFLACVAAQISVSTVLASSTSTGESSDSPTYGSAPTLPIDGIGDNAETQSCMQAAFEDDASHMQGCEDAPEEEVCPETGTESGDMCRNARSDYCQILEHAGNAFETYTCIGRYPSQTGGDKVVSLTSISKEQTAECLRNCYVNQQQDYNNTLCSQLCFAQSSESPSSYPEIVHWWPIAEADIYNDAVQLCLIGCYGHDEQDQSNCEAFLAAQGSGQNVGPFCRVLVKAQNAQCSAACVLQYARDITPEIRGDGRPGFGR